MGPGLRPGWDELVVVGEKEATGSIKVSAGRVGQAFGLAAEEKLVRSDLLPGVLELFILYELVEPLG